MASSVEFKDFVLECLQNCESGFDFKTRKMFGEYCFYMLDKRCEAKPCFLLCDDMLFVKAHKELESLLCENEKAKPFEKAKLWYVLDPENLELLKQVVQTLALIKT